MKYMALLALALLMAKLPLSGASGSPPTNEISTLSLGQALLMAESHHPRLTGARARIDAATGRMQQVGRFPNPEAIARVDQVPLGGNNTEEFLAGIEQPIPLGGRLSKARQVARWEREVLARDLEVARRELHRQVRSAFATALYQHRAHQAQQSVEESVAELVALTRTRVETGDALPADLARIEVELARAALEIKRAGALRRRAMRDLAASMGDPSLVIHSLEGSLEEAFEIRAMERAVPSILPQPGVARAEANAAAARARRELALAERIPDVKVEALYHRLEATGDDTIDLGIRIPLPLFNRQQGRLREAEAEEAAAEAKVRATRAELEKSLEAARTRLSLALAQATMLRSETLPRAETILATSERRREAGDISLVELLPVRRDLKQLELTYLESLREVMEAWAEWAAWADPVR